MKILHLTRHLEIGGIPRYVMDLSTWLQSRGHDVTVASTGGPGVVGLERAVVRHHQIPLSSKFEFGPNLWRSWMSLASLLMAGTFDVVHSHPRISPVLGGLIQKFHGVPSVTTCHGFFKPNLGRRLWPCWGERVIAVSPAIAAHLTDVHRVASERIFCIPNGIDASKYKPCERSQSEALRRQLGIPANARVVGTAARLSPVKGLDCLLEAFAECLKE